MTRLARVLVVGGGLAGVRTAERLRARGYAGALTLLSAEPHAPYDRPPLSKQVLRAASGSDADDSTLRSADELAQLGVDLILHDPAVRLDAAARVVVTASGSKLSYDVLVIATGASPRRLPRLDGVTLRTIDDARALRARMTAGTSATVVGAGLIGCEVAASARSLGVDVDLVDLEPGPMIRVLGPQVAAHVARLHADHGVRLHLGTRVTRDADGALRTEDGSCLRGTVVLEAVGIEPVTGWLADSGLPLGDGVVCDGDGRAAEGVYAVGDVACWAGTRSEHWTATINHADHVSAVVLGQPTPPADPAYWWSDQYDVKIQGIGSPRPSDQVDVLHWGPQRRPLALYARDGSLTGVVGFSTPVPIVKLRADVAAGTPIADVRARLQG